MTIFRMIKIWLQEDSCVVLYFNVAAEYSSMQSTEHRIVTLADVTSCLSVFVVTKCRPVTTQQYIQQCKVCYMFR